MKRTKRQRHTDPFVRACTACGACVGKPCCIVGNDSKPLATRATRLVHAARLEEGASNA